MSDTKIIQKNKLQFFIASLSSKVVLVFSGIFISIVGLIYLIKQVTYNTDIAFDQKVFTYLSQHISKTNTWFMQVFTFFGSHKFLVPAWLFVFARYSFLKDKWSLIRSTIIASSNLLLLFGLKYFFNRPRPLEPLLKEVPGLSFPSGHAYMSLIFFGLHIYFIYKHEKSSWVRWTIIPLLILTIIIIGVSRIYLRLHYASDVLAGYCIGIFSLIIHLWLIKKMEQFSQRIKIREN